MAGVARSVGGILAYAAGAALGGRIGGAIASTLFGLLMPQQGQTAVVTGTNDTFNESADPGTVVRTIHGLMPVKAGLIDCGIDPKTGLPAAIISEIKKDKKGDLFGIGGVETQTEVTYLKGAFFLATGTAYCEQIRIKTDKGEKVEYDRYNAEDDEMPNPESDPEGWREFLVSQFDGTADYRPGAGIQFTPQYAPDGTLMAEISQTVRMYPGTEWQLADSALQEIHGDQVCPYVGISYVMYNKHKLKPGSEISYMVRSLIDGKIQIIRQKLVDCGTPVERVGLRSLEGRVSGCAIAQAEAPRELIEKIAALDFHDLMFLDGGFRDVSRLNPATWVLDSSQLGARFVGSDNGEPTAPVEWVQKGARELPTILRLRFLNIDSDFEQDEVVSIRQVAGHENEVTLEFPFTSTQPQMLRLVDVMMDELWAANSTENIKILSRNPAICPGNLLVYDANDGMGPRQIRITKQPNMGAGGVMENEGLLFDFGVYGIVRTVEVIPKPRPTVQRYEVPDYALLDLPSYAGTYLDTNALQLAVGTSASSPWSGAFFESETLGEHDAPSRTEIGELLTSYSFTEAQSLVFNAGHTIRVRLRSGTLQTANLEDASNGANLLSIQTPSGTLLISFKVATPVSGQPLTYDISDIWPGRFGTEKVATAPSGSVCVVISDTDFSVPAVASIPVSLAKIGVAASYEVSATDEPTATTGTLTFTPSGRSLRPPQVANVIKADDGADGYVLKWMPRTRDFESAVAYWSTGVQPRETDPRRFTVILRDGSDVVDTRTLTFSTTESMPFQTSYTEAQLIAIFGSVPSELTGSIFHEGSYLRGDERVFEV